MSRRVVCAAGLGVVLSGCVGPVERGTSEFSTTRPVQAVVTENVTSCVVDGVCGLRLEFSDTTVFALYGSGERPTPSCSIGVEVSDAAFAARSGASVTVVLEECVGLGLILREIRDPIGP